MNPTMEKLIKLFNLSPRESEVAYFVSLGVTNKEAANSLLITEKTVKFHLTNIYRKMSVKSRGQLIVRVIRPDIKGNVFGEYTASEV